MNILLVCSQGASTSILVQRLLKEVEKKELHWEIEALPILNATETVGKYDLILVAPQVTYQKKILEKFTNRFGVPLLDIDPVIYGKMEAITLVEKIEEYFN